MLPRSPEDRSAALGTGETHRSCGLAPAFGGLPQVRPEAPRATARGAVEEFEGHRYSEGARPSFSVAGLSANPSSSAQANSGNASSSSASASQLGGGLMLTIPFGGNAVEGCGRLAALQERRSKLALGAALLEQGLITQEQFQQLGASIARDLGIPAASSGSLTLPTKPVYEPPPPVNIGPSGPSKPSGAKPFQPRFPPVDTGSGTGSGTPGAPVPAPAPAGAKNGGRSRPAR